MLQYIYLYILVLVCAYLYISTCEGLCISIHVSAHVWVAYLYVGDSKRENKGAGGKMGCKPSHLSS